MGQTTGIEWTNATVNFWVGCHKVSAGCKFCYMFTDQKRYGNDPNTVRRCKDGTFLAALKWKEPRKIFTCSWSDFFIKDADDWRVDAFEVIRKTPQHTWQILTKRPERITASIELAMMHAANRKMEELELWLQKWAYDGEAPHNVWMGTSVENQAMADKRIPELLKVPAVVRFLSCEPLLGTVDLRLWEFEIAGAKPTANGAFYEAPERRSMLHWVICGGESGSEARPMHPFWARDLRNQCAAAGVPFFFKQWGEWAPVELEKECWHDFMDTDGKIGQCRMRVDGSWAQDPRGSSPAIIQRLGKKKAGRLLDGVEHNGMPQVLADVVAP